MKRNLVDVKVLAAISVVLICLVLTLTPVRVTALDGATFSSSKADSGFMSGATQLCQNFSRGKRLNASSLCPMNGLYNPNSWNRTTTLRLY